MKLTNWPAMFWTAFILCVCWLPSNRMPIPETSHSSLWNLKFPHADKLVHFGIFATYTMLWFRTNPSLNFRRAVVIIGLILAVLSELGQAHPWVRRDPDILDIVADVAGVLIAASCWSLFPKNWTRSSGNEPVHH